MINTDQNLSDNKYIFSGYADSRSKVILGTTIRILYIYLFIYIYVCIYIKYHKPQFQYPVPEYYDVIGTSLADSYYIDIIL